MIQCRRYLQPQNLNKTLVISLYSAVHGGQHDANYVTISRIDIASGIRGRRYLGS